MKILRVLFRMNKRMYIFLSSLFLLFISPLIVWFDYPYAASPFVGFFCLFTCLMSYWIYEDGKKIEHLERLLNSEKNK